MSRYDFKFGDTWISELGAVSTDTPMIEIAQRDYDLVKIPGKNGDDYIDNGRYNNVPITRSISFVGHALFPVNEKVVNFINTYAYLQGYQSFEDTDHNDMVTEAVLLNFNEVNRKMRTLHSAKLKFSRKPFWFLKEGLEFQSVDLTANTPSLQFNNPFPIASEPLIKIQTTAGEPIDNIKIRITTNGTAKTYSYPNVSGNVAVYLDCEKKDVRIVNGPGSVAHSTVALPKEFGTGKTKFELTAGKSRVASVSIAPRWRCL